MARVTINPSNLHSDRGLAIQYAKINNKNDQLHLRISEMEKDFIKMEMQLRKVVEAARAMLTAKRH